MAKEIKIAFIGNGYIARQHLGILKTFKYAKIIGYLDGKTDKFKISVAKKIFGKRFNPMKQLIASRPDMVYICTPPYIRFKYEQILIKNKINYFVEKPPIIDKHKKLLRILSKLGNKLIVIPGFQWRFFNFNNLLMECLKKDSVRFIYAERLLPTPFKEWKLDKEKSGGIMYEFLIHMIDYCQFLFKADIKFIKYCANSPKIGKNNDKNYNLNDAEILIFKIKDILCNVYGTNYTSNNNYLKLTFVGQKKLYRISFNKNNKVILEIINNNRIEKVISENFNDAYKKENDFVMKTILKNKKSNMHYMNSLAMAGKLIAAIKKGEIIS